MARRSTTLDTDYPSQIGDYRVVELLGKGSFASVFRTVHTVAGTEHALKLLDAERARNEEICDRFRAEAEICQRLCHPNVIAGSGLVMHEGRPALVLEYLAGGSLENWLDGTSATMGASQVREIALAVLDALSHAHEHGVVHRDIKPANILLRARSGSGFCPVLSDFGIARLRGAEWDADRGRSTVDGTKMGTWPYMSPEQTRGGSFVTERSDQYSVAMVFVELLTRLLPYDLGDAVDTMDAIRRGGFRLPQEIHSLDGRLAFAVERAISVDPGHRFSSCSEFANFLRSDEGDSTGTKTRNGRETVVEASPIPVVPEAARTEATSPVPVAVSSGNWVPPTWMLAIGGLAIAAAVVGLSGRANPRPAVTVNSATEVPVAVPTEEPLTLSTGEPLEAGYVPLGLVEPTPLMPALPIDQTGSMKGCAAVPAGQYLGSLHGQDFKLDVQACGANEFTAVARATAGGVLIGMAYGWTDGATVRLDLDMDETPFDEMHLEGQIQGPDMRGTDWNLHRL